MPTERKERNEREVDAITAYLQEPYARMLYPDITGRWIATVAEFQGCMASGRTPAEAIEALDVMAAIWIREKIDNNESIPRPSCINFIRALGHFD